MKKFDQKHQQLLCRLWAIFGDRGQFLEAVYFMALYAIEKCYWPKDKARFEFLADEIKISLRIAIRG